MGFLLVVIEDAAEVDLLPGVGILLGLAVETLLVDVAQSDDVFGGDGAGVSGSSPSRTDDGNIELVIEVLTPQQGRNRDGADRGAGKGFGEPTTCQTLWPVC